MNMNDRFALFIYILLGGMERTTHREYIHMNNIPWAARADPQLKIGKSLELNLIPVAASGTAAGALSVVITTIILLGIQTESAT